MQNRRGWKKRGYREVGLLILTVPFFAALLAAVHFYLQGKQREMETEGLVYEANIVEGDIPGKTPKERQWELDSIVEEGMPAISINATPCGKTTRIDKNISWLIKNPSNQGKLIRVEVWRGNTMEKIYETGAIPSGNYMKAAPLSMKLPPGECRCIARPYVYKEDETYIGQAAAQIRLVLQG